MLSSVLLCVSVALTSTGDSPERLSKSYGNIVVTYPAGHEEFAEYFGAWISGTKGEFVHAFREGARQLMVKYQDMRDPIFEHVCKAYLLEEPTPAMTELYDTFINEGIGETASNFDITKANIWEREALIAELKKRGSVDSLRLGKDGRPSLDFRFGIQRSEDSGKPVATSPHFDLPVVINLKEDPTLDQQLESAKEKTEQIFAVVQEMKCEGNPYGDALMLYVQLFLINLAAWESNIEEDDEKMTNLWIAWGFGHYLDIKIIADIYGPEIAAAVDRTLNNLRKAGPGLYEVDLLKEEYSINIGDPASIIANRTFQAIAEKHGEDILTLVLSQLPDNNRSIDAVYATFKDITGEDMSDYIEPTQARLIAEYEALPPEEATTKSKE